MGLAEFSRRGCARVGLKVDAANPTGAVRLYERLGFLTDEPAGGLGRDPVSSAARVSLQRWLRRQLRQPEPLREHLEAAIQNDDPAEARRVVAKFEFSPAQQRHVGRLLDDWEHGV